MQGRCWIGTAELASLALGAFLILSAAGPGLAPADTARPQQSVVQKAGEGSADAVGELVDLVEGPELAYGVGHADRDPSRLAVHAFDQNTGRLAFSTVGVDGLAGPTWGLQVALDRPSDRVVVTGNHQPGTDLRPFALALDANSGRVAWMASLGTATPATAVDVVVPDGGSDAYVATWSHVADLARVHALDPATGDHSWTRTVGDTMRPVSLAAAEGGPIVLAAWSTSSGTMATIALAASNGTEAWTAEQPGAFANGYGLPSQQVVVDPTTKRVFVAGSSGPAEGPRTARLFAYELATGSLALDARLSGGTDTVADVVSVGLDPGRDRLLVATAARTPANGAGTIVHAVDAITGGTAWTQTVPELDRPAGLVVDGPDDRVYVHGATSGQTVGARTVAFDASHGRPVDDRQGPPGTRAADVATRGSQPVVVERIRDEAATRVVDLDGDRMLALDGRDPAQEQQAPRHGDDAPGTGQWVDAENFTQETVHATLLPNGTVLYYTAFGGGFVFSPEREATIADTDPQTWLFCSGMALLADGRLYAPGGTEAMIPPVGIPTAEVYDPRNSTFAQVASMEHERWYPTAVTLGTGNVGVLTGITSNETAMRTIEQALVYDAERDAYRDAGERRFPTYSKTYVVPSGEVLVTAPARDATAWNPRRGTFATLDQRDEGRQVGGGGVLVDAREGTVLEFGGAPGPLEWGFEPGAGAELYDHGNETWREAPDLHHPRVWTDAVMLPTGNVAAIGGVPAIHDHDGGDHHEGSLPVELYLADENRWVEGPAPGTPYAYHSTSLLLPDGRVLAVNQHQGNAKFYEPAYLDGERPRVVDAPDRLSNGVPFHVTTEGADVDEVVGVRHSTVTHSLNTDQRRVELNSSSLPGFPVQRVLPPANPWVAVPGPYMLFALDGEVPSIAPSAALAPGPTGAVEQPTAPDRDPTSHPAPPSVDATLEHNRAMHLQHKHSHDQK